MSWITALESSGHITEAVSHFNQAIGGLETGGSRVEVSRYLFDALNKIQTEWRMLHNQHALGEVKAFQTMILEGLDTEDRIKFLESDEIRNLVFSSLRS